MSYPTQVGNITQKLEHFRIRLIIVGMDQNVAMPTAAETTITTAAKTHPGSQNTSPAGTIR